MLRNEIKKETQQEFANKLRISRTDVSKLEHDKQNVDLEKVLNVLDIFKSMKSKKDYKDFILKLFS